MTPGKISTEFLVCCVICHQWDRCWTAGSKVKAKEVWFRAGWKLTTKGWVCPSPDCQEKVRSGE